jgi:hypothetical protein
MVGSRTMTTLATLLRRAALLVQSGLPVWRLLPGVIDFLVTGLTRLGSHILGYVGGRRTGHRCGARLNRLTRGWRTSLAGGNGDDEKKEDQQKG